MVARNASAGGSSCRSRRPQALAFVLTDDARSAVVEGLSAGAATKEEERPFPGGITPQRFEEAQRHAAGLVAKLTLLEKISQLGCYAPAIERVGLPAFNYYANEALHGLNHNGR